MRTLFRQELSDFVLDTPLNQNVPLFIVCLIVRQPDVPPKGIILKPPINIREPDYADCGLRTGCLGNLALGWC